MRSLDDFVGGTSVSESGTVFKGGIVFEDGSLFDGGSVFKGALSLLGAGAPVEGCEFFLVVASLTFLLDG